VWSDHRLKHLPPAEVMARAHDATDRANLPAGLLHESEKQ